MADRYILFLIHQGFSFIDDLLELARITGFKPVILSSRIKTDNSSRVEFLQKASAFFFLTDEPSLKEQDIDECLYSLQAQGIVPAACMSVWEGYRGLMSDVNGRVGAVDEPQSKLDIMMDKYTLRTRLLNAGLSRTHTRVVKPDGTPLLFEKALFIKPRRGLGSFGAFRWNGEWLGAKLNKIRRDMMNDDDYAGFFSEDSEFVAEDEIDGEEYSFEVVVNRARPHVLAVHEKIELAADYGSVLENSCVSPPSKISGQDVEGGRFFVARVLRELKIETGCYHIEARYSSKNRQWEIIEINPRVGGAFIFQSTKWVSGQCLLRLWLETLIPEEVWASTGNERKLNSLDHSSGSKGRSYFRVYFGEPGRTVDSLKLSSEVKSPNVFRQIVKPGSRLPESGREIFLGQALWLLEKDAANSDIMELDRRSKDFFEVSYAP